MYDERLVAQLIQAAGTLATVADQASVVLSEEFESMVHPQIDAVRAILEKLPTAPEDWDGELHERDLEITYIATPHDSSIGKKTGVKIVHRPTGIGRESLSKPTQEGNKDVALRALKGAVVREYAIRERNRG